jgi:hypothetical protein
MAGTGIALAHVEKHDLQQGDEVVRVVDGPTSSAILRYVPADRLLSGARVLVASLFGAQGARRLSLTGNAHELAQQSKIHVANELESLDKLAGSGDAAIIRLRDAILAEIAAAAKTNSSSSSSISLSSTPVNVIGRRAAELRSSAVDTGLTLTEMAIGVRKNGAAAKFFRPSTSSPQYKWHVELAPQSVVQANVDKSFWIYSEPSVNNSIHWRLLEFLQPQDVVTTSTYTLIRVEESDEAKKLRVEEEKAKETQQSAIDLVPHSGENDKDDGKAERKDKEQESEQEKEGGGSDNKRTSVMVQHGEVSVKNGELIGGKWMSYGEVTTSPIDGVLGPISSIKLLVFSNVIATCVPPQHRKNPKQGRPPTIPPPSAHTIMGLLINNAPKDPQSQSHQSTKPFSLQIWAIPSDAKSTQRKPFRGRAKGDSHSRSSCRFRFDLHIFFKVILLLLFFLSTYFFLLR